MTELIEQLKQQVAAKAVELITDGMVVGLGTGSTSKIAIDLLGARVSSGELSNIIGIPTSEATALQAEKWGIELGLLIDYPQYDLAIDGADEVTPELHVTKGWGGALVREKLVETHAKRLVIMVDERKMVPRLGTSGPIPVEVTPFAWQIQARWITETLGCTVVRREHDGQPYITDNQNYILHCTFAGGVADPYEMHQKLAGKTGIVGHGLFLDMATDVLVATSTGVQHLRR